MTVINRNRDAFRFLFGDASDGSAVISSNTNLASVLNGDIVERKYLDLTINAGAVLSVSNPCKGLILRVRGVLTLNGTISMSNKACAVPGGGSDLFIHYNDIKIPVVGAPGGAAPGSGNVAGLPGTNGTDGQCGGGGSGASAREGSRNSLAAAGSDGYGGGGGQGGSGAAVHYETVHYTEGYVLYDASPNTPYGGGVGQPGRWNQAAQQYPESEDIININGRGGDGASPAGGILIIIANRIVGSGALISAGSPGGNGSNNWGKSGWANPGGGGSGGGSIVLFYSTNAFTGTMTAPGGTGGQNAYGTGLFGGKGGDGSVRDWSLVELASHTRI